MINDWRARELNGRNSNDSFNKFVRAYNSALSKLFTGDKQNLSYHSAHTSAVKIPRVCD